MKYSHYRNLVLHSFKNYYIKIFFTHWKSFTPSSQYARTFFAFTKIHIRLIKLTNTTDICLQCMYSKINITELNFYRLCLDNFPLSRCHKISEQFMQNQSCERQSCPHIFNKNKNRTNKWKQQQQKNKETSKTHKQTSLPSNNTSAKATTMHRLLKSPPWVPLPHLYPCPQCLPPQHWPWAPAGYSLQERCVSR